MEHVFRVNKICLVALSVLVVYNLESKAEPDLVGGISQSISNIWEGMKKAIRRPVRIKRLGHTGRTKSIATSTTPQAPYRPSVVASGLPSPAAATAVTSETVVLNFPDEKLVLPVLPPPQWLTQQQWMHLQKPKFAVNDSQSPSQPNLIAVLVYKLL